MSIHEIVNDFAGLAEGIDTDEMSVAIPPLYFNCLSMEESLDFWEENFSYFI